MSMSSRIGAAVATAAVLAAAPVAASAAGAQPASGHPSRPVHHARPGHGHGPHHAHGKPTDRLHGLRNGVAHAIAAQLKAAKTIAAAAASLDIPDAAALQDALTADVAAVSADRDAVSSAGSRDALHKLLKAAIATRQVAMLQFEIVSGADTVAADASTLGITVAQLQGQLADLDATTAAAGIALLADADQQLETVSAGVPDVVGGVLALAPNASGAQVRAARGTIGAALASLRDALAQAEQDVANVQADYGL